jgi:hypothetical protein
VGEHAARGFVEADAFDGAFGELGLVVDGGVALRMLSVRSCHCFMASSERTAARMARAPWRPRVEWSMAGVALTWPIAEIFSSAASVHFFMSGCPCA